MELIFDTKLINKYNTTCPRYTSYPTAVQFKDFTVKEYIEQAKTANNPRSIYIHLPFCAQLCYFCGCNKIITQNNSKTDNYLKLLEQEIILQSEIFGTTKPVTQLHFGGGTPTFFQDKQLEKILELLTKNLNFNPNTPGEYSIEIDPRTVTPNRLHVLKSMGLNRISIGIQDFNPVVQDAINRVQDLNKTREIILESRKVFNSTSVDLIYGLPLQTTDSFKATLREIISLSPDRISLFNYAHMPDRIPAQKKINNDDIPSSALKLKLLNLSIEEFTNAGYVFIGMDHFAKPNDPLAKAQRNNTLYRNFQGYSTHAHCDLIGLGVSAISSFNSCYSQNHYKISDYTKSLEGKTLAVNRGISLSEDDILRRDIIMQLMCHFRLDIEKIESQYSLTFNNYFKQEINLLRSLELDRLVKLENNYINILPKGKILIRNICYIFDIYSAKIAQNNHSKAI